MAEEDELPRFVHKSASYDMKADLDVALARHAARNRIAYGGHAWKHIGLKALMHELQLADKRWPPVTPSHINTSKHRCFNDLSRYLSSLRAYK